MEAEWRIVVAYILLIVFIRSCHCQSTTPGTTTEEASLHCPYDSAYSAIQWYTASNGRFSLITTRLTTPPSLRVNSPWNETHWTILSASGDLFIPQVLLSDEGTYQCSLNLGVIHHAVKLQVHVRPTSFTIEPASLIPTNSGTKISATCTADEVRPKPEFSWELCGEHIPSTNSIFVVNSTYNVYGYSSTVFHTVVGENHGCQLTCTLMMQSATEERKLTVQVNGFGEDDSFSAGPVIGGVFGLVVIIIIVALVVICQRNHICTNADRSVKTANDDVVQYVNSASVSNRPTPPSELEHTYTRPLPPPVPSDQVEIPIYNNASTASLHHNRSEHYDDVISDPQSKDTPVSNANPGDHTYTSLDQSTRNRPHYNNVPGVILEAQGLRQ